MDLASQARELNRMLSNSLEVASKVKKYLEEKGNCQYCSPDELAQRRKEIDELRRRVLNEAEANLKTELL